MNAYAVAGFVLSPFHALIIGGVCVLPLVLAVGVTVIVLLTRNRE